MFPYLFIVYIDDLSNMLNSAGIGCHIHNCCTNHVFYADDVCVIAPSPSGLQDLLNICAKFGFEMILNITLSSRYVWSSNHVVLT